MKKPFSIFNFPFYSGRDVSRRGFTLIEMIVSLAIFAIVAVVALGALMKIVSANKKAQSLQSAMTNINFALESISREMRVGSNFSCYGSFKNIDNEIGSQHIDNAACDGIALPPEDTLIAFKSSHVGPSSRCNLTYAYYFEYIGDGSNHRWDIKKNNQTICNKLMPKDDYQSIIDENVVVTGVYLTITEDAYPLATFRISGYTGVREKDRTYFDIQTAVSARVPTD